MAWGLHLLHLVLPGAPLVAAGRLLSGALLMAVALLCLCVAGLVALGLPGFEHPLLTGSLGAYGALGLVGLAASALLARTPPVDAQGIRLAHRQAAGAFLRREHAAALAASWRLCRLAGEEPGAWLLLLAVAQAAGDVRAQRRARRQLDRLRSQPRPS